MDPKLAARLAAQDAKNETGESAIDDRRVSSAYQKTQDGVDPKLAARMAKQDAKNETGESAIDEVSSGYKRSEFDSNAESIAVERMKKQQEKVETGENALTAFEQEKAARETAERKAKEDAVKKAEQEAFEKNEANMKKFEADKKAREAAEAAAAEKKVQEQEQARFEAQRKAKEQREREALLQRCNDARQQAKEDKKRKEQLAARYKKVSMFEDEKQWAGMSDAEKETFWPSVLDIPYEDSGLEARRVVCAAEIKEQEAAVVLAAGARGRAVRADQAAQKEAAAKIQAVHEGKKVREDINKQKEAAVKIEAVQRGHLAREQKAELVAEKAAREARMEQWQQRQELRNQRVATDAKRRADSRWAQRVPRGGTHQVELLVTEPESYVVWEFFTEDAKEIGFGVFYKKESLAGKKLKKEEMETVLQSKKYTVDESRAELGEFWVGEKVGLYVLRWTNTHDMLKTKDVVGFSEVRPNSFYSMARIPSHLLPGGVKTTKADGLNRSLSTKYLSNSVLPTVAEPSASE